MFGLSHFPWDRNGEGRHYQTHKIVVEEYMNTAATMAPGKRLEAHERPPEAVREVFKLYSKMKTTAIESDQDILDFLRGLTARQEANLLHTNGISKEQLQALENKFQLSASTELPHNPTVSVYEARDIPGTC